MSQNETPGMTGIGPIVRETPLAGHMPRRSEPKAVAEGPDNRALVPVAGTEEPHDQGRRRAPRSSALFLAQLIANERQLPQTRERRRAEPSVALAAYGAAAKLVRRRV